MSLFFSYQVNLKVGPGLINLIKLSSVIKNKNRKYTFNIDLDKDRTVGLGVEAYFP